ncbi:hypothetical protein KM800_12225 [Clostridium tyrobutyricum]|uniref:hypothetical protein n=1 Tax=Clostridium tyrobutyricum TaxID=1519 RepID=UPI001C38EA24|nr:hypothetical protein [Clostridium tyrobutyricum]MBV4420080.1 hypothetical protein [Clostridium tyrobutyricum]
MSNKYLILANDNSGLFSFQKSISDKILIKDAERGKKFFQRFLRKIHYKFNLPFTKIWFPWINDIKFFDTIIIFDRGNTKYIAQYIANRYPNKRIIIWFWNSIKYSISPKDFNNIPCEVWSFDKMDCKKYELNYNTSFYFDNIILPKKDIYFDICFIGSDKNRMNTILSTQKLFSNLNLKIYYHVVASKKSNLKQYNYKQMISYTKILEIISSSKIILDLVAEGQNGPTLRPLEAAFFHKKLITNYKNIQEFEFYDSNNIFILGKDDINTLQDFVRGNYVAVNQDSILKYNITNWIKRFKSY